MVTEGYRSRLGSLRGAVRDTVLEDARGCTLILVYYDGAAFLDTEDVPNTKDAIYITVRAATRTIAERALNDFRDITGATVIE